VTTLRLREHPAFTRYWAGQSVSVAGTRMRQLTIAWLVLEATGSELWLAGTALAGVGAMLLFTPAASVLADRVARRSIILAAESGSLAVSLALAAASLADALPAVALVAAAALLGALHAFEAPARNVLVHDLVTGEALLPALSLFSASQGAAQVLGPAVGGLLLERVGAPACFLVDAGSYVVLLAVAWTLPRVAPSGEAGRAGGLLTTLREVWARPAARRTLSLLLVLAVGAAAYQPLLPAVAAELLELGPDGLGALQACGAVGALCAGLALGRGWVKWPEQRLLAGSALLVALPLAGLAVARGALAAAVAVALVSLLLTGGEAAANTRLQRLAPEGRRARHVGLYTIVVHLFPLGGWLLALGAAAAGLRAALLVLSAAILVLAAGLQGRVRD
jgi:MFS family permease